MDFKREWARSRDELVQAIRSLGFPDELGEQIAKMLGSPKAMERMMAYLYNVKPNTAELIVDEALAICSDIDRWREKKASEAANAKYNEMLYYGFDADEDYE
ncbi:hypothetical protein SAMN04487830_11258 [Pseudobutyrivibrio sp. OR37]|uniref:hypothetical protein n=1 Tax=Pseudobutyrivibrio sp. OR37 TaxID=1798186 RepID=UPI0008E8A6C3|nr:hypothetical protein [Pseudobutyrivibrio sp. OR37]SFH91094.1 hypothetical protein SAMN04487830_11258 [Pseudobutyrivibrio sp. OR37]